MLPLSSTDLETTASELAALAASHAGAASAHADRWASFEAAGNRAAFITAARESDSRVLAHRRRSVAQMSAVSDVLRSTANALRAIEIDLDRVIARTDAATQHSPDMNILLQEIASIGLAIDRACAREIASICTEQAATTESLSDYADLSLDAIHELELATASPEVRALAEKFPDARLLPASDGVVLAFGDIETSPSVTTIVPGVGSADPKSWPSYAARAQSFGTSVLFLDYRAPGNLLAATATNPAAIGGARLQNFQAELRRRAARKGNQPYLTVLGHSYGSVVAGHAAKTGLNADALVVMGSPGIGVAHASELDLRGDDPQVIAVTSPHDPIGLTVTATDGVHGPDPADPAFGATHIWPATGGHSFYWEDEELRRRLAELS